MISRIAILAVLSIAAITGLSLYSAHYYPSISIAMPEQVNVRFLYQAVNSFNACETITETAANAIRTSCPDCKSVTKACPGSVNAEERLFLSDEPINFPSMRIPKGITIYSSPDPAIAAAICQQAEGHSHQTGTPLTCRLPGTSRPFAEVPAQEPQIKFLLSPSLLLLALSGIVSMLVGYFLVRYESLHSRWSHDHLDSGPQKFHATPTPRIGGLAILLGLLTGGMALLGSQDSAQWENYGLLLLAGIPAFAGGFAEDLLKSVKVRTRLLLTMAAAAAGVWLLGGIISRVGLPFLDSLLTWMPLAIALTLFAVSGVANAINIVDGYNGLAGGYAALTLVALAAVAGQLDDAFVMGAALAMIGALLGFLAWNYPSGKIFLGDGGAYLVGFWLAELSVLLMARHKEVSPWFPILILIYPVFETLFSIVRRKLIRGHSPGQPDSLHMHQLIYLRLIRVFVNSKERTLITRRNSAVAIYVWGFVLPYMLGAVFFWNATTPLIILTIIFCLMYVWLYRKIIRWKAPHWIIKRSRDEKTQAPSLTGE